eukprot:s1475_g2.t1
MASCSQRGKALKLASFLCAWQLAELVGSAFTLRLQQSPKVTALRATLIGEDGSTFERLTTKSSTPQAPRRPRQASKEQEPGRQNEDYDGDVAGDGDDDHRHHNEHGDANSRRR